MQKLNELKSQGEALHSVRMNIHLITAHILFVHLLIVLSSDIARIRFVVLLLPSFGSCVCVCVCMYVADI
jgi:hypothetical protein